MKGCNCEPHSLIQRQVEIKVPAFIELRYNTPEREKRERVFIDICLAQEVWTLWEKGIVTTGCCCGHKTKKPYIGVEEEYIPHMKHLGYKVQGNDLYPEREDSFVPKFLC